MPGYSLVEVMKGEPVALNCTALGAHDHFVLEWFLVSAPGWGPEGGPGAGSQGTGGQLAFIPSSEPKGPKSSIQLPFHFTGGKVEAQQGEGLSKVPWCLGTAETRRRMPPPPSAGS